MKLIRILVNGAFGRMGQEVCKAVCAESEFELVGQLGRKDDLANAIQTSKADIVIDFTLPNVVYNNFLIILDSPARPVVGTTGLSAEQVKEISKKCAQQKKGAILAPNFSIGAVLMMHFAQQAARFYSEVEIIELHHSGKIDAPSGTAIKTAEMIAAAQSSPKNSEQKNSSPSRGATVHGIPVHAVRLPGIVANQEVLFGGMGETLSIHHNTINREAFMPGVVLACKKVLNLDHFVYGLENILL